MEQSCNKKEKKNKNIFSEGEKLENKKQKNTLTIKNLFKHLKMK